MRKISPLKRLFYPFEQEDNAKDDGDADWYPNQKFQAKYQAAPNGEYESDEKGGSHYDCEPHHEYEKIDHDLPPRLILIHSIKSYIAQIIRTKILIKTLQPRM